MIVKPIAKAYPKKLATIGDHIRAWRITNNLRQADIAKRLDVCEDTIVGWEMRNIKPTMKQMPGITHLIGYLPIEIDTSNIGGKITMYRYKHGLSPKEFGVLLPVDASTVRAWESGINFPQKRQVNRIQEILSNSKIESFCN